MGSKNIYERFIWFDDQARRRRFPNTTMLSREFEISVKTAQRDIEFMRERLDCPLLYDEHRKGYCYEDETFSLPLMYLSSAELSSLMVARKLLQDISGSCIADEITSAVEKITTIIKKHAVCPESIDDVMSFHLIEYSPAREDIFRPVLEACLKNKRISFAYNSPARNEETRRKVDPYHLFNYMGAWHLIGYCHLRNSIRNFKLNRISSPALLDETFRIPKEFSSVHYFNSSFGLYKGGDKKQVLLRFTPNTAKWISDQIWHPDQETRTLKDGSLELSFPVADFSEITREILKYGSGVEVIKPAALRLCIKAEIDKASKIY